MKNLFGIPLLLMHLIINAQTMDVHNISDYKWLNLKQNDYEKKEFIIDLGNVYCNAIEKDTAFRRQIVCFMLDSIIGQGNINSALASKILMQYSRINEYDDSCIDKILNILNNGYCNLDFLQLAGCIGDEKFNNPIYSIYNSDIKKNKLEMEMLKNTLARLGNQEMIEDRLSHFKSILNTSTNPIKQEYADALRTINYINRKELYDMLIGYIINDNGKIIIVGDYGGDPYGGDDNIYCTLSTFLLELLSDGIVDFPIKHCTCFDDKGNPYIEIIKEWIKSNNYYQLVKWHPYYGYRYMYWQ